MDKTKLVKRLCNLRTYDYLGGTGYELIRLSEALEIARDGTDRIDELVRRLIRSEVLAFETRAKTISLKIELAAAKAHNNNTALKKAQ